VVVLLVSEQQFYETVQREQEYLKEQTKMSMYAKLSQINVNEHVEKKSGLSYLTWSWAWDVFKKNCPDATYKVIKNADGLPYFESDAGAMVYTEVTAEGMTHEMWLPVMDGANNAMKKQPYTYDVKEYQYGKATGKMITKTVEAFTMFDVNKTVMRCLVKNLAMFGLGIYIYSGEDLPTIEIDTAPMINGIKQAKSMDELQKTFTAAWSEVKGNSSAEREVMLAKEARKSELAKPVAVPTEAPAELPTTETN
jgi:hypothetical protein